MNLVDLETFLLVVDCGTFSGAAARMGVPTSTVSRRVARLEDELGLALLQRSSRSFALTEDGVALHARCAPAVREIADVERTLADRSATPRGSLAITTPIDLGSTPFIADLVACYGRRYPDVRVRLSVTNRRVDLVEEGVDVAFRLHIAPLDDSEALVTRVLGRMSFGVYASPAYVAEHGAPENKSLLTHRGVGHALTKDEEIRRDIVADDFGPVAAMVAAGAGVARIPEFVALPYVQRGELLRVIEGPPGQIALSLLWARNRHLAPRVRAFVDLALEKRTGVAWLG